MPIRARSTSARIDALERARIARADRAAPAIAARTRRLVARRRRGARARCWLAFVSASRVRRAGRARRRLAFAALADRPRAGAAAHRARARARGALRARPRSARRHAGPAPGRDGARFLDEHPVRARSRSLRPGLALSAARHRAARKRARRRWPTGCAPAPPIDEVRARQAAVAELRAERRLPRGPRRAGRRSRRRPDRRAGGVGGVAAGRAVARRTALVFGACARRHASSLVVLAFAEPIAVGCAAALDAGCRSAIVADLARARFARSLPRIDTPRTISALMAGAARAHRARAVRVAAARGAARGAARRTACRRRGASRGCGGWCRCSIGDAAICCSRRLRALLLVPHAAGGRDRSLARGATAARSPAGCAAVGELEALSALATYAYEHPARSVSDARRRRAGVRRRRRSVIR